MHRDLDGDGRMDPETGPGLQPRVSVEEHELKEFRETDAARHLARLEGDSNLLLNLTTDGFGPKSRTWPELSDALIEYGNTVIRAWVVTGHVFAKCKEKGVLLDARGFSIPRPDALIMAEDTVADAIINFRDYVLKQNKWDPSKGASLTTFFVGNCLLRFPNIYREWISEQNKTRKHDPIDGVELINRLTPEMQVIRRDESERNVEHMLAGLTEQERTALTLKAEGWGIDEIAEVLELSYKAAESVMYRARQAVKKGTQT